MSVVRLPDWPGPASVTPRPISSRNELRPGYGGPVNRLNRPGTRWAWDVVMPPMTYYDSLDWDDLLSEADTVRWDIPQPDFETGAPGLPKVDSAGQAGSYLIAKSLTANYVIRKGQWLSIEIDGQIFAYKVSREVIATNGVSDSVPFDDGSFFSDGTGFAQEPIPPGLCLIPLRTMLRRSPPDNAVINLAEPLMEGFATVDPSSLEIDNDGLVRLKFTIEERE